MLPSMNVLTIPVVVTRARTRGALVPNAIKSFTTKVLVPDVVSDTVELLTMVA